MTATGKSRARRIARRIALALAVPVLLLSAYVGSYLVVNSASNDAVAAPYVWPIYDRVYPLWDPIRLYERSTLPFSVEFRALDLWCWHLGCITWHEAYELATGGEIQPCFVEKKPKPT